MPPTETELDFVNDRDASLKLIDWFKIDRVHAAKVLVVGAGAIGNEVLKNLALLGVGNVCIFDRDTIERSNLSRSILFRKENQGHGKAVTAARAVRDINDTVKVTWHAGDIETDLGEGLIRKMDAVIGCLDGIMARYLLNRLCWRAGVPWVDAGIGSLNGEVRVFRPPDGPCYECHFTPEHYNNLGLHMPCGAVAAGAVRERRIPTTPTIASVVAGVQVQEFLKLLDPAAWTGRTLIGRQLNFNGQNAEAEIFGLPTRDDCPAHETVDPAAVVAAPLGWGNTAGELLAYANTVEGLGPGAWLYWGQEIAVRRVCRGCGDPHDVLRPMRKVDAAQLQCAVCGRVCKWESDLELTHILSGDSPPALLNTTLRDLGIPCFGIVEAQSPNSIRHLELSADAPFAVESDF